MMQCCAQSDLLASSSVVADTEVLLLLLLSVTVTVLHTVTVTDCYSYCVT